LKRRGYFIGDYLINKHVAVERKTTRDFVISIIDGRFEP